MEITLINYSPNPELMGAAAARLCRKDISAKDIMRHMSMDDITALLDVVTSSGHLSVLEHINFSFAIDGVSRVLTHQLVRHRVGIAFSQQSQRYTDVSENTYITPRSIENDSDLAENYKRLMEACFAFYRDMQKRSVPNEDARFILPQAVVTRLIMTVNMRQLLNMYNLDACLRSQWEIREFVNAIKSEIDKVSPRLAGEMKIKCFRMGYCDEKMMCEPLKDKMPRKEDIINTHQKSGTQLSDLEIEVGENT